MKAYERAILDAERDVKAQRVAEPLSQRLLQSDQIELYYGMPALFEDYERFEHLVLNEIFLRVRNSEFGKDHDAQQAPDGETWQL